MIVYPHPRLFAPMNEWLLEQEGLNICPIISGTPLWLCTDRQKVLVKVLRAIVHR